MAESTEFIGKATPDGHFKPTTGPNALRAFLKHKAAKDKTLRVIFEDWRPTRSNQQNRAWFGIVVKLFCERMGYRFSSERDKRYVHEQILIAIGWTEPGRDVHGQLQQRPKDTHDLDTAEFSDLYNRAQELGAQMDIVIPDPDPELAKI